MEILIPYSVIGLFIISELFKRGKQSEKRKRIAVLSLCVFLAGEAALVYTFIIHPSQNRSALLASGIETPAEITGIRQTGNFINNNPQVEFRVSVQPEDKPAYTATITTVVQQVHLPAYTTGKNITVLVDPDDTQNLLIKGL